MELSETRDDVVECPHCGALPLIAKQVLNCRGSVWRLFDLNDTEHTCPTNEGDDK